MTSRPEVVVCGRPDRRMPPFRRSVAASSKRPSLVVVVAAAAVRGIASVNLEVADAFAFAPSLSSLLSSRPPSIIRPPLSRSYRSSSFSPSALSVSSDASFEATSSASSPSSSSSSSSFDKFDYLSHWYPISWARDLPYDKPTKITVFDVDYVVSRTKSKFGEEEDDDDDEVMAMLDRCPHKSASLSEGRVTERGARFFQCAYHGWSFDGKTGECVEIPQIVRADDEGKGKGKGKAKGKAKAKGAGAVGGVVNPPAIGGKRARGTAVPAMISQGMVWLFPGGGLERALLRPPPPLVPEWDLPNYRATLAVRDFPVDWTILLENLLDPDHGVFAHQMGGFDLYSASSGGRPQEVAEESLDGGRGWRMTSRVDATEKLVEVNKYRRGDDKRAKGKNKKEDAAAPKNGTIIYEAPCHLTWARRDPDDGTATFVIAFYVTPVGVGRSRFLSASIGRVPFSVPRWIVQLNLLNFVDQDTYLLKTQERYVLEAEARAYEEAAAASSSSSGNNFNDDGAVIGRVNARRNLFAYRSPTERMQSRLGAFLDSTLGRSPNRARGLRAMRRRYGSIETSPLPSRDYVLDRYAQHTSICRDSADVLRNCQVVSRLAGTAAVLLAATKAAASASAGVGRGGAGAGTAFAAALSILDGVLLPKRLAVVLAVLALAKRGADRLAGEYRFKYTEKYRDRDLARIPKVWADPE
eukprot:CAMPEP_0183298570 /NCGR_PEP_ID=MMETSP0160_2-20130417/5542_1 /TAXON_ID=2839 ORGANISM="Odontella Sinensis, Strain Grunow 1884" /NCGR_SAMPLE_ID=MMETSP0160_2 /ASSEMBLY_ACC=CAM_ASM_000250 /LENGTH=695 /DNA_ID=CAMNT_0025460637 /DNA_START=83 /DNA_END=2170 /DNA_ORIENTATION=-